MKITYTVPKYNREHKQNEDFLSVVLDHVFSICKNDPNFSVKSKTDKMDIQINSLNSKIKKQLKLLEQANEIEENTHRQLKDISEQNFSMKARLLEILGSEI